MVSGGINADRGTANNDQPDRRNPGEVLDAMRRTVQGVHQLAQALKDFTAGKLIRAVDDKGEIKKKADGSSDLIVNDPYLGGTHLMDVRFVKPFFYRGALWCWLANTGHWPDIGGMVPGGFSAKATEVEQEGLRLPPVKLFKRGVMDPEIHAIIRSNMRIADQRIGDIRAQAAALKVGEKRLTELIDRYGRDTIVAAIAEI